MLGLIKTLVVGSSARAEEAARNHFAVDLLDQKIRESEAALSGAKETLAALIMRERNEERMLDSIKSRIADLENRTKLALAANNDELAGDGASAIADLQNERNVREDTLRKLRDRTSRMRLSIEKTHRRIIDLKQGMIQARAIDAEGRAQKQMNRTLGSNTSIREAEELLGGILDRDDPFEEAGVLDEIDASLSQASVKDRMAAAGFGDKSKVTGDDVLARLKAKS